MEETLFSGLAPDVVARMHRMGTARSYPPRSYIFHEGETAGGVYIVDSGVLRIDRTTARGRVALLDLVTEGALIGELSVIDDHPRSATLSTVTACRVRYISGADFRSLMREEPSVQTAVLRGLGRRIRALSTQFLEMATMDSPRRIASRLMRLVEMDRLSGRPQHDAAGVLDLKLPINQEELGQWSGLTREGAVKGLTTLRSLGIIETGRLRVKILDLERLASMAGTPASLDGVGSH